ncbi:MAG: hypothetical protein JWN30_2585 [Bacilli bacterium]|nr:hypothetical protein [Bacilli bacterium]
MLDHTIAFTRTSILTGLLFTCFGLLPYAHAEASGMVVDSFDGPVTQNEINSFKSYIQTLQPVVWPNTSSLQSEYAQGHSGESIKAMGLMYEVTGDTSILDRMIYFDDVLLSQRNDILAAPYGQRSVWTNTIAPVWPGSTTNPAAADSANGDMVGHLAYCARLILQHPSIWNTAVPNGDSYGHGVTYRQRAATFLTEADHVVSQFFFPSLLNLSFGNKYYFSTQSPYMTGAIMPWNQQMMISYGLENLADGHAIIGDNPTLVSQYDGIVQTNLNWFFSDNSAKKTYADSAGNTAYNWGYNPSLLGGEDSNHGSLDVAGFYRAYLIGRYGITAAMLTPFANMYTDVMMQGPHFFAGRVDGTNGTGHGAPTSYVRSGNLFLTDLRPDKYYDLVGADLTPGSTTTSMDTFSRFIWAKNQRQQEGYSIGFSPAPGPSTSVQTVTLSTFMSGALIRYTTDGSTPSATNGTLYSGPFSVSSTTTVKAVAYTSTTTSPVSIGTYTIWAAAPTLSPAGGTYSASQSVTISSPNSSATIRYTTDGSTPSLANGTLYTGPVKVSANTTLRAIAFSSGLSPSNITSGDYTITIASGAAAPTFSPGGGTYFGVQTVTMSSSTPGGSIYFSTDGSIPSETDGTLYTAPLKISSDTTLNAITYASGLSDSPVASASYIMSSTPIPVNLALGRVYNASSIWSSSYIAAKAFDANTATRWSAVKGSLNNQWLSVDFGAPTTYNQVVLKESSFQRVTSYILQSSNDGITYADIPGTAGTFIGSSKTVNFTPVNARFMRLFINTATAEPTINELEVYNVDKTPPITTDNAPSSWVNQDVTVNLTASDGGSGVAATYYTVDGGQQQSGTVVSLTTEGVHTLTYWSVDNAGNIETQHTATVKIDKTAPVSSSIVSPGSPDGSNGWYTSDVTINLAGSDNLSGIAKIEYRVNDGTWSTYSGSIPSFGEGVYQVDYRSKDQAGNLEQIKSIGFKIDKTAPKLSVQLDKTVIWPADHKMVTINAKLDASDQTSGVASIVLTSITSNEPDSGEGDIQANFGTTDTSFSLRAERLGNGTGRIYTITYTVTDFAGNKSTAVSTVSVPHNQ